MSFCVNKSSSIFLSLFQFVKANFVSEEMVWQTAPVSDDSKTLKLKIKFTFVIQSQKMRLSCLHSNFK